MKQLFAASAAISFGLLAFLMPGSAANAAQQIVPSPRNTVADEPMGLSATGRADGINVSAGTVTTHDGTVRSGITFVDPKDAAAVKLQTSGPSGARSANVTNPNATNLHCIQTWHTIAGGASNSNWKPNSYQTVEREHALQVHAVVARGHLRHAVLNDTSGAPSRGRWCSACRVLTNVTLSGLPGTC